MSAVKQTEQSNLSRAAGSLGGLPVPRRRIVRPVVSLPVCAILLSQGLTRLSPHQSSQSRKPVQAALHTLGERGHPKRRKVTHPAGKSDARMNQAISKSCAGFDFGRANTKSRNKATAAVAASSLSRARRDEVGQRLKSCPTQNFPVPLLAETATSPVFGLANRKARESINSVPSAGTLAAGNSISGSGCRVVAKSGSTICSRKNTRLTSCS